MPGHVSEQMHRVGPNWRSFDPVRLFVAIPPAGGRGAVDVVGCDENGEPTAKKIRPGGFDRDPHAGKVTRSVRRVRGRGEPAETCGRGAAPWPCVLNRGHSGPCSADGPPKQESGVSSILARSLYIDRVRAALTRETMPLRQNSSDREMSNEDYEYALITLRDEISAMIEAHKDETA